MMLKKKSKLKLFGIITCNVLLCLSYVGISLYSVPEKVNAVTADETRTISKITFLQEMNKYICDNSKIGDVNENVTDVRDGSVYSIGKLSDGKCWMTQNLRITKEKVIAKNPNNTTGTITPIDSNIAASYDLPDSTTDGFDSTRTDDYYQNQQIRAAENNTFGAYYSYNVATANTVVTDSNGNATYDICPKGWRLPTSGNSGDFASLRNKGQYKVGAWSTDNTSSGYWFGGGSATATGAAFFPAAGNVRSNGLISIGTYGYYWSSTYYTSASAYSLTLNNSSVNLSDGYYRYAGYSIRCVANENITESEYLSGSKISETGAIAVKVSDTISIDAVSGMEKEVDSTKVANGTITATIATNASDYKVLLGAEKTSLTSTNSANDAEIPASTNVSAGTNAWGILNSDNTTYSAITTQEKEYYHTTAPSTNPDIPGITHTFNIGISVSPSLPSDTYSTDVTITALAV